MKQKYMTIFGGRPQWFKVLDNLENHVVVNTGQHYDYSMDGVFSNELKLKPKHNLGATTLGRMVDKCVGVVEKEDPGIILVIGDTKSTLAGAIAAKMCKKTLAHIESGMRSYDMTQPEEVARVTADRLADYRFCANDFAAQNLIKEGITKNVFVVGDPLWDSLNRVLPIKPKRKDYILLTIHREQNDRPEFVKGVFEALEQHGKQVLFPVHPRMQKTLKKLKVPKNIELLPPQPYKDMIRLETGADKVLTDSGGVQREAYWFAKPVIILRTETEWKEIVDDGWAVLTAGNRQAILHALNTFNPHPVRNPRHYVPDFGSKYKIAEILRG